MDQHLIARAARDALPGLSVPVFLAGSDGDDTPHLTLHIARQRDRQSLQREAAAAMARAGAAVDCRVRWIDHGSIDLARTLQDVLRSFAHDAIVYDPTHSISRAKALVELGRRLRGAFGYGLRGLYLEPDSRSLFLLYRPDEFLQEGALDAATKDRLEGEARAIVASWQSEDGTAFGLSIRLCFELPPVSLVPLDPLSLDNSLQRLPWMARLHAEILVGGVATLLGMALAAPARAQDANLPAVSGVNGKVQLEAGEGDAHPLGEGIGSLTFPLGQSFGGQIDAGGASDGGHAIWGLAGQGFWRNPDLGLVGGFYAHMHEDLTFPGMTGTQLSRSGVEGALYLGRFTPQAEVGFQSGGTKNGAFGVVELGWYPTDNLLIRGGADLNPGKDLALADVEYQLGYSALPGLSVFAEGGVSGERPSYALFGFRYYFGATKTLIRRHREDDPDPLVINQILGPQFGSSPTPMPMC